MLLYCEYVESKLKEYYMSQISDITNLEQIREDVLYLLNVEGLKYMEEVLNNVECKIDDLREEHRKVIQEENERKGIERTTKKRIRRK